jgi:cytochrome c553
VIKNRLMLAFAALVITPLAFASGDASVGKKLSTPCAACHGAEGVSASPEFPNLAGQHPDYLVAALKHYKNGKRKNAIMADQVKNLEPKQMADLAAYFSSQRGLQQVRQH